MDFSLPFERKHLLWAAGVVALLAVLIGIGWSAYWTYWGRWQPKLVTHNQAEIQKLLDAAGWVSPGYQGPWAYVIETRSCTGCNTYEQEEFPKLHAAQVDTRVIAIAPRDTQGETRSTVAERATVAELWINRDWKLYQTWINTPVKLWSAPGVRLADGDLARTAVVDAGRNFADALVPLLKANGVDMTYPIVIWKDSSGQMKICACSDRRMFQTIRHDLGAPDRAPGQTQTNDETATPAGPEPKPTDKLEPLPDLPNLDRSSTDKSADKTAPSSSPAPAPSGTAPAAQPASAPASSPLPDLPPPATEPKAVSKP